MQHMCRKKGKQGDIVDDGDVDRVQLIHSTLEVNIQDIFW